MTGFETLTLERGTMGDDMTLDEKLRTARRRLVYLMMSRNMYVQSEVILQEFAAASNYEDQYQNLECKTKVKVSK